MAEFLDQSSGRMFHLTSLCISSYLQFAVYVPTVFIKIKRIFSIIPFLLVYVAYRNELQSSTYLLGVLLLLVA